MQHVDNAHLNLSADRPPFHTPGKMIVLISINREEVDVGHDHKTERQTGISAGKSLSGCGCDGSWNKLLNNAS